MIVLKDKNVTFPELYPDVERNLATAKEEGWAKVNGKLLRDGVDIMPQPGLQEWMQTVEADILFIGGQPGGGKSFGIIQSALDGIEKTGYGALIVKKELTSTKDSAGGIIQDAKRVYMPFADCEYTSSDNPTFKFPSWGTSITFTHSNFSGDTDKGIKDAQEKAKNTQCSHIFFDELTDHDYKIWSYWLSRNRDSSGVPSKMICTFNTNSHHFTRRMIDWYIDDNGQVRPDRMGVVRYFVMRGESERDILWGDSREELILKANIVVPDDLAAIGIKPEDLVKAFTFMPCKMADNRILMNATSGAHAANIFNLGGEETDKLFNENWNAESEGEATVTKKEVRAIFSNPTDHDTTRYATFDVSGGGDGCFMWIWEGNTMIEIEGLEPIPNEDNRDWYTRVVEWVNGMLYKWEVPIGNFAFDATGVGDYLKSFTDGRPLVMNSSMIQEIDSFGNVAITEKFYNLRSQLLGKIEFLIKTGGISCTVNPQKLIRRGKTVKELMDVLIEESDVFRKTTKANKTYFNSKLEFKHKYHYSPDIIDPITLKAVFLLDARPRKEAEEEYSEDDYYSAFNL